MANVNASGGVFIVTLPYIGQVTFRPRPKGHCLYQDRCDSESLAPRRYI